MFFTPYSLRYLSEVKYVIHHYVVIVLSVWHSLLLRNNLFVLARRTTAIVLSAELLGCEKLNRRNFKLLSPFFFVFSRPPRRTLPQTFSVTAAVVAPAVVICLNSLIPLRTANNYDEHRCRTNLKKFTILYQGPNIWNTLPVAITSLSSFPNFKKNLMEFLFK